MIPEKIKLKLQADELQILYDYTVDICQIKPKCTAFDIKLVIVLMMSLNKRLIVKAKFPNKINIINIPVAEALALHKAYKMGLAGSLGLTIQKIVGIIDAQVI